MCNLLTRCAFYDNSVNNHGDVFFFTVMSSGKAAVY